MINIIPLQKIAKAIAVITFIIGALLVVDFFINKKNVEIGTFIYFYLLLAGVINGIFLFVFLLAHLFAKNYNGKLLQTSAVILLWYLTLVFIIYFLIP